MGARLPDLLAALLEAVLRRPLAVLLAWAAAAALCVAIVLPMRIDGRVEAFLPERDRHLADYSDALRRFGLSGTMFVAVDAPPGGPLREAVDRVRGSLSASELVREILGAPDEAARMRTARALAPEVALLLPGEAYGEMEARLDAGDLRSRMEEHYERLVGPGGGVYQQVLRGDPLELGTLVMAALARFPGEPGQRFEGGALLSADGRHALLTAIPAAAVGDEAAAVALESLMDGIARDLGDRARLTWVGGHRFYLANSRTVQADVQRVSTAALLLVLGIVLVGFWAARILGLAALAVVVASLGGLAAGVLAFGPVSGVALAFGGALGGICVDYVLHLHAVPRAGEARVDAVRRVFVEIGPTVVIGAATSAAAFLVLLASPVPVHRQIGVVAAAGILVALAFSLTAGPVLAAGRRRQERATAEPRPTPFDRISGAWFRAVLRRPGAALAVALVLLAASAAASPALRIEKDLRRFESKDPATVEAEGAFAAAWGGMLSRAVVLVPGDDLQAALRGAEAVESVLRGGGAAGSGVLGPSAVLPSLREQDRRWERWRGFWTEARVARLREDLSKAGGEFGIRRAAFDPFLESLPVRPPPVTPELLRGTAFEAVLARHLHEVDGRSRVLLLAPGLAAPGAEGDPIRAAVEGASPGTRVLTGKGLADAVADATFGELAGLALPALALVGILLAWYYGRAGTVLVALFPLVGGLVLMAGILVAAGEPLSMLSIPAVIPVFGMGVDYGVFLIDALAATPRGGDAVGDLGRRSAPVLGAMLTTLATGAALLLARHPGFRTLGIAMLAGIGSSFLLAWLAVPRLLGWKGTAP